MTEPTKDKIAKLPMWAQDHIRNLQRALDVSKQQMTDFCDSQSPSLIWYEELVCDAVSGGPSHRRVYLQTHRVVFGNDSQRDKTMTVAIDMDNADVYQITAGEMQIKPRAYNSIEIKVGER